MIDNQTARNKLTFVVGRRGLIENTFGSASRGFQSWCDLIVALPLWAFDDGALAPSFPAPGRLPRSKSKHLPKAFFIGTSSVPITTVCLKP